MMFLSFFFLLRGKILKSCAVYSWAGYRYQWLRIRNCKHKKLASRVSNVAAACVQALSHHAIFLKLVKQLICFFRTVTSLLKCFVWKRSRYPTRGWLVEDCIRIKPSFHRLSYILSLQRALYCSRLLICAGFSTFSSQEIVKIRCDLKHLGKYITLLTEFTIFFRSCARSFVRFRCLQLKKDST